MTALNDFLQSYETDVDDDVQLLSETPEEMLTYSGDKNVELKARVQLALDDIKMRMSQSSDTYYLKARQLVSAEDDHMQENPWHGIGIGALVELVVRLLLVRR